MASNTPPKVNLSHAQQIPADRRWSPLRQEDGGAFTRADIQHDLLHAIFTDNTRAFTDPNPLPQDKDERGLSPKCTFAELYVNELLNSSKCSKHTRDTMLQHPGFAVEFAQLCLLVNIGRINTTVTFDWKATTQLRYYVCIPSLMRDTTSSENMLDVPRIRGLLRGCLRESELNSPVSTPLESLVRAASGVRPPTSIPNLIFCLATHSTNFSRQHFEGSFEFLDLFIEKQIPAGARARAFLWLIFRYYEGDKLQNPWDDPISAANPPKAPALPWRLPPHTVDEDKETDQDIQIARYCKGMRQTFLRKAAETGPKEGPQSTHLEAGENSVPVIKATNRPPHRVSPHLGYLEYPEHSQWRHHGMLLHAWQTNKATHTRRGSDEGVSDIIMKAEYGRRLMVLRSLEAHRFSKIS